MYAAHSTFEDDLFYHAAPSQTRYYADEFDAYAELEDNSWDKLLDPNARPRPDPRQQPSQPPPIGHGEVTTSGRTARQKAYAQLMQHQLVGISAGRGHLNAPMSQQSPRQNTGLALVDPRTGVVQYTVFDPSTSRVLWHGSLGTLASTQRRNPQSREDGVRTLLAQQTNQNFHGHNARTGGPDLLPISPQQRRPTGGQRSPQSRPQQQRPTGGQRSPQSRPQQQRPSRGQRHRFDAFAEFF